MNNFTMRGYFLSFLLLVAAVIASAAEYWIEPVKYRIAAGEELKFNFAVGENFGNDGWNWATNKVASLQLYAISGTQNILPLLKPVKGQTTAVKLTQEGTYVLAYQTAATDKSWRSDDFDLYTKEQGLDEILDARSSLKPTGNVTESCTRFARSIVQVGQKTDDTFKKRAGKGLEIIPLSNPYTIHAGDYLECLVLNDNKPLPHTLIKVWGRLNRTVFLQNIYTENDGTIKFPISTKGVWMVSTTMSSPVDRSNLKYKSLVASLTFEITSL